ncbi:hypothetical protein [Gorillibacterium sp. sgz500922]|uniref:hypothetical protein n=1 Tax=Gorillibacterium sp. sgz500922 TaxID=3446694 RepID=UPI003F662103
MNCCGHSHDAGTHQANGQPAGRSRKRNWIMGIGCALPAILVGLYLAVNGGAGAGGPARSVLPYLVMLICPLSHLVLMPLLAKRRR